MKYAACPSNTCFLAKLLEDGKCRSCNIKPEKAADGITAMVKIRKEDGNCISAKTFTKTLCQFYTSVRPGCSIANKDTSEIEDLLFDVLPVNVEYNVNMFNTPYTVTTLKYSP
jgi:hypothetical protein